MIRRAAGGVVLAAAMLTGRAAAQEAAEAPVARDIRVEAKSALMFNQHLYFGAFERPRALAYDRGQKELWVADAATGRAGVYRSDGSEIFSFYSPKYLRDVARLLVSPRGELLVLSADRAAIHRFSYRGEYKGDLDLPATNHKRVIGAFAYDADGNLYVGDNAVSQVSVYTTNGRTKLEFGSHGKDDGQFFAIAAIVVAADGAIIVVDQEALAVQRFDAQGNFVRGWGRHEMGGSNFSLPSGAAVDSRGRIYVTDELRHQVKIFTPDGMFLGLFGGLGNGADRLSFPTDVVIDEQDRVIVCERFTARVQVFVTRDVPAD
jgi:DNA-binding beta-propeller fold protein YncE